MQDATFRRILRARKREAFQIAARESRIFQSDRNVQRPRDRIAKLQNYIVENALIIIFATCRRIGIRA